MNKNKLIEISYDKDNDFVQISSDIKDFNILYCNGISIYGLQCDYHENTKKYNEIKTVLDNISNGIKQLYKINMEKTIETQYKNKCPVCGNKLISVSAIKYEANNDRYGMCDNFTMAIKHYCSCGYEKIEEC